MNRSLALCAVLIGAGAAFLMAASMRVPDEEWELKAIEVRFAMQHAGLGIAPEDHTVFIKGFKHLKGLDEPEHECFECHGFNEPDNKHSCTWCHSKIWGGPLPATHDLLIDEIPHAAGGEDALANCTTCHGPDLRGGIGGSCRSCHYAPVWRTGPQAP